MRQMVPALDNALPHLQPPKRVRGKATELDASGSQPHRRRRCRVSDQEAEQIRLNRLAPGDIPLDQTEMIAQPEASQGFTSFVDPTA